MSYQDQINDQASRMQTAYTAWRGVYMTMTPPPAPLPTPDNPEYKPDNKFIRGILGVILAGSMIVSGSHTIPTFAGGTMIYQIIVGVSAFFMLEAAIVAFAYIRTQRHYQTERAEPENLKQFVNGGLGIAFLVAMLGNIDYTLRSKGFYIAEIFQVGILLGMAISAPVLAFITGDIMAMYQMQDRVKQRRHLEDYEKKKREVEDANRAAARAYEEDLNKAWDANKSRWGGSANIRIERPEPGQAAWTQNGALPANSSNVLSSVSNGQIVGQVDSHFGHKMERNALGSQTVWDYLEANPDAAYTPSRHLEAKIGASKSTIDKVQNDFIAAKGMTPKPTRRKAKKQPAE
jgi:uncharacterized membrane protein